MSRLLPGRLSGLVKDGVFWCLVQGVTYWQPLSITSLGKLVYDLANEFDPGSRISVLDLRKPAVSQAPVSSRDPKVVDGCMK